MKPFFFKFKFLMFFFLRKQSGITLPLKFRIRKSLKTFIGPLNPNKNLARGKAKAKYGHAFIMLFVFKLFQLELTIAIYQ